MRLSDDIIISHNRAIARSYAKINLTLDVLGKRENGYHDVRMIMQSLGLFDLLIIDKVKNGINISCNIKYLPVDARNIAYKAADLFFRECGINGGAKILIHKNIPIAAGLAGGSGNAAAVLCALDLLYNTHLGTAKLCELGLKLGADVPFCILGGTQLAEGIGERLTALNAPPKLPVLLVKPSVNISTAQIYNEIDNSTNLSHPNTNAAIAALNTSDTDRLCGELANIMQKVTERLCPEIDAICKDMLRAGAAGSVMSGSGPTVFGLFKDMKTAKNAADLFSKQYNEVYLTKTYN